MTNRGILATGLVKMYGGRIEVENNSGSCYGVFNNNTTGGDVLVVGTTFNVSSTTLEEDFGGLSNSSKTIAASGGRGSGTNGSYIIGSGITLTQGDAGRILDSLNSNSTIDLTSAVTVKTASDPTVRIAESATPTSFLEFNIIGRCFCH